MSGTATPPDPNLLPPEPPALAALRSPDGLARLGAATDATAANLAAQLDFTERLLAHATAQLAAVRSEMAAQDAAQDQALADKDAAQTAALQAQNTALTGAINTKAASNNAALTGAPIAPTPAAGDNSTRLSTTAFVQGAIGALGIGNYAPLNSPTFTGTPRAPDPADGDDSTRICTTARLLRSERYVIGLVNARASSGDISNLQTQINNRATYGDLNGKVSYGGHAGGLTADDPPIGQRSQRVATMERLIGSEEYLKGMIDDIYGRLNRNNIY